MKEFIEKLIAKLEEKFKYNSEQAEIYRDGSDKDAYFREKKDLYMDRANTYGQVMRIVNQLAEEYSECYKDCEQCEAYNKGREEALQEVLNCESYGYEKGLNDAWELAKKLYCDTECKKIRKIYNLENDNGSEFGKVIRNFTPQEALAKLEAYEKEQAEIKVGDVVTIFPRSGGEYNAVVVRATNDMHIDAIYSDGITTCNVPPELYKKTGKHIDIQSILQQIGGEQSEN